MAKRINHPEHVHQAALFDWASNPLVIRHYPQLDLLQSSLNGVKLTPSQAAIAKAAGMRAGVLDVRLPVARGGYHGLEIEMKYGKNKPTDDQLRMIKRMTEEGYCCAVCYSWTEARDLIVRYLEGKLLIADT